MSSKYNWITKELLLKAYLNMEIEHNFDVAANASFGL